MLGDARPAFLVQKADQGFAHAQFGNGFLDVQIWIGAHGLGTGFHSLLIARRKSAQCMLHAIAQLAQNCFRHIQWVLGDKINPHAFRPNETDQQLHPLYEHFGRLIEKQVRFVKEEDQFGLFRVTNFWQLFKQFRQQPKQEGAVQSRRIHEFAGTQQIDDAFAFGIRLQKVLDVEHGFAKKLVGALALNF